MKNSFIVIEGLEGAGKTTLCKMVRDFLKKKSINNIMITHDPGGTPLAEKLRFLIKNGVKGEQITDKAELLMLYAARAQLIEMKIKPALAEGTWVISDRYDLSTEAYQGYGRNFHRKILTLLRKIIVKNIVPDLILYLDVTPELGLKRAQKKGKLDRIEKESLSFFSKVRNCYLLRSKKDNSIKVIDATQPLNLVKLSLHIILEEWWTKIKTGIRG
ncbi:MAG: dTMP kinase [Candidatus Dasytiphilus stammeri]